MRHYRIAFRSELILAAALVLTPALVSAALSPSSSESSEIRYMVEILPRLKAARVTIRLHDDTHTVRGLALRASGQRYKRWRATGDFRADGDLYRWVPPTRDAELSYQVPLTHTRASGSGTNRQRYDAVITDQWAILRGDDLVPSAKVRLRKGAPAPEVVMELVLPEGWTAAVPYLKTASNSYRIQNPHRRFDRPTGWFALGHLSTLREHIGKTKLTISAPLGHGARRMDVMALLRWTLPELSRIMDKSPERLLVVIAGDPMWHGGLSGPHSLYLHASLPLISHDGTSPLLHELVHTFMEARSGPGGDWITEGFAELYALELLHRTGTISAHRYRKILKHMAERGKSIRALEVDSAHGALTARAVAVLHKLDRRLRRKTENRISLDNVLQAMVRQPTPWTTLKFRQLCEQISGLELTRFFAKYVSGPVIRPSP